MSFLRLDVSKGQGDQVIYERNMQDASAPAIFEWANGNRLLPCSTPWYGSRPSGMPRARGGRGAVGRPRRGRLALRFWRNPHGIRESVESVSVESAISKKKRKMIPREIRYMSTSIP